MRDFRLQVNGLEYGGWKAIEVTRGVEMAAGKFTLRVSERWAGQDKPWPIREGDACVISIGGEPVISGYIDGVSLSYDADGHETSVLGRDAAGALVDCSAVPGQWEYRGTSLLRFVQTIANAHGISVSLSGVTDQQIDKATVDPGDSAWEAIERACRQVGVLAVSDGAGGLVLTRTGSERCATALIQGKNILSARADYDTRERYHTYRVFGQHPGSDSMPGASAAHIRGEATDSGESRSERVLLIRSESGTTKSYARQRAEWEAIVRAARGDAVMVRVAGWGPDDDSLWPINALVGVTSSFLGVDGTLLITQATYTLDEGGEITELELRRPDAFTPAPEVVSVAVGEGGGTTAWKELAGGV